MNGVVPFGDGVEAVEASAVLESDECRSAPGDWDAAHGMDHGEGVVAECGADRDQGSADPGIECGFDQGPVSLEFPVEGGGFGVGGDVAQVGGEEDQGCAGILSDLVELVGRL
ncbi:MAG: hypothetical protein KGP12_05795 [Actinomycetales bacterium]|nr:hypothetical protein [Actinomycetales bacterium]